MPQTRDRKSKATPKDKASGLTGIVRRRKPTRMAHPSANKTGDADKTLASSFDRIHSHRKQAWARGSLFEDDHAVPSPTSPLVRGMRAFIRDREIRSIVDVGCGEMSWWAHVLGDTPEGAITYHGFDICPAIVQHNREQFIEREDWHFDMADGRFHEFPAADLTICRRTLNYLWSVDAAAVRLNIARNATLLAITHDPEVRTNRPDGMRRAFAEDAPRATTYTRMNTRRPPFMPMPIVATIADDDDEVLAIFPARQVD